LNDVERDGVDPGAEPALEGWATPTFEGRAPLAGAALSGAPAAGVLRGLPLSA